MIAAYSRSVPILLSLFALLLAACSQNLESNIAFQEQVARADQAQEDLKVFNRQLSMLDTEFQQVSKQVARLKNNPGGGDASAALVKRIERLEKAYSDSQQTLVDMHKKLEALSQDPARQVAAAKPKASQATAEGQQAARLTVVGKEGETKETGTKSAAKRSSARQKTAAKQNQQVKPAMPSGIYHLVTDGQTIDVIAANYKVKPLVILNANRLPNKAQLVAGQRLYVPRTMN